MKSLSHRDTQAVLESIRLLHTDLSAATLAERTLAAVSKLVSADIICFDCFSSDHKYVSNQWHSSNELMTSKMLEVLAEVIYEHPLFVPILDGGKPDALKISDFLDASQFHYTGIYNEFFRQVGVDRQMIVPLKISPDAIITCAVNRLKKDFSESDRNLLTLFAPHLTMAIRNTQAFEQVKKERDYLSSAVSKGLIVLSQESEIKFISSAAVGYLKKYFGKLNGDKLPEDLHRYIEKLEIIISGKEFYDPALPLHIRRKDCELTVSLTVNFEAREVLLLFEEKLENSPRDFMTLGLTTREAEVLFWIGQGKTDPEIAVLCNISQRTVQKHAEHLFIKLGVETRTAAIGMAITLLKQK